MRVLTVQVDEHRPSANRRQPYRVLCSDDSGSITLVFFHPRPDYLQTALPVGETRVVSGMVQLFKDRLQMTHPDHIGTAEEQNAISIMHEAIDEGMTFFDNAWDYHNGGSEEVMGKALATGGRREKVFLMTKVCARDYEGAKQHLEDSLRRLQTDYIDLWMLHFPDDVTPIAETLGAMQEAVDQGKVRQLGCSNFDAAQLSEAHEASSSIGSLAFVCNQVEFSMVHRDPDESGLRQLCVDRDVALLPYYPLANGLLTGKTRRGSRPVGRLSMERYQSFLTDENFDIAEGVERYAQDRGLSMVQVALGWLLAKDGVPSVTPGATKADQVHANAAASEWRPDPDSLADLNSLLDPVG